MQHVFLSEKGAFFIEFQPFVNTTVALVCVSIPFPTCRKKTNNILDLKLVHQFVTVNMLTLLA